MCDTDYIFDPRANCRRSRRSYECEHTSCDECDGFVGDADYDCLCSCHDEDDD